MERVGLYGGTFGPPHLGHVRAAEAYLAAVCPDRLIVMPAGVPPHKQMAAGDTPDARLRMCELAFGGLGRTEVSDYEISRGGISYTVNTLAHLAAENRQLDLLCGTDMFLTLDRWFRSDEIFRLARVVGVSREEGGVSLLEERAAEYRSKYGARTLVLRVEPFPLSSTEIRARIAQKQPLGGLLPEAVRELIEREHLYESETEQT